MIYLESFRLPGTDAEDKFILSYPYQLEMQCYSHDNVYPFKIFPQKKLEKIEFDPITVFYGGNGSGKSTLLNVIAEKLQVSRSSAFNNTPFMSSYTDMCSYELPRGKRALPVNSIKITSDDVFDFLLDVRSFNEGVDRQREEIFEEWFKLREDPMNLMKSLSDFDNFKKQHEAKRKTKSAYATKRMTTMELDGRSNGESAYVYFTQKIKENALYILDEPENSLSAKLQEELAGFIEDSARFYGCQFIISTHSPFLLSMKGARIYDLDRIPAKPTPWTELQNVRVYYEFFQKHMDEFK